MAFHPFALPDNSRLPPTHSESSKSLRRLSRDSLINLALSWLDLSNQLTCAPVLDPEADASDPALASGPLPTSVQIRQRFAAAARLNETKKEVLEAIGTHWSAGLTLRQWAMADEVRIVSEMGEGSAAGQMLWGSLKAEKTPVEYGDLLEPYAQQSDYLTAVSLRVKPAVLKQDLQQYLGPLIRTHASVIRPAAHWSVLRIVCFGDDTSSDADGNLMDADSVKVLHLAFQDIGSVVYASPITAKLHGDDAQSLIIQALERLMAPIPGSIHLVIPDKVKPLNCHDLFNAGPADALKSQPHQTEAAESQPKQAAKPTAPKAKVDPEKRRKMLELRKMIRFQAKEDSDVSSDDE